MHAKPLLPLVLLSALLLTPGCDTSLAQSADAGLDSLVDESDADAAEKTLLAMHAKNPRDPEVMTQLARLEYKRALAGLPRSAGMPPEGWDPKHMDAAERWIQQAIEANPKHASAWVVHGQIKYARFQLDQSLEMLTRAESLDPTSIKLRLRKGATLRALSETHGTPEHLKAAAREFQKAIQGDVDNGNELLAAGELGDIFSELGDTAQALDYNARAAGFAKGNAKAFLLGRRAQIRLYAGDAQGALAESEAALAIIDTEWNRSMQANALLVLAGIAVRDGKPAQAKPLIDRAIATGTDPWEALHMLASKSATFPAIYAFVDPETKGTTRAVHISEALVPTGAFITPADLAWLHRMGIQFNASDEFSGTLLHGAIRANNVGAVKALLELGANPTALHLSGRTPLELALTGTTPERREIRRLLVAKTGAPKDWKDPGVDLPRAGHWYAADRKIGSVDETHVALPAGTVVLVQSSDCWFPDRTDICLDLLEAPGQPYGMVAVPLSNLDELKSLREVPAPTATR